MHKFRRDVDHKLPALFAHSLRPLVRSCALWISAHPHLLDDFEAASAALTAKFAPEPAPDPIPEPPRVSAPMHTAGPMVSAPVTREVPGSYQY
jgi:hypothetical protein